jgi:hypothetical protein
MFGKKRTKMIRLHPFKEKKGGSPLGGQWKEKEKVLMLGGQWKEKEKFPMFGSQWKEKEKGSLLPLFIFPPTNFTQTFHFFIFYYFL